MPTGSNEEAAVGVGLGVAVGEGEGAAVGFGATTLILVRSVCFPIVMVIVAVPFFTPVTLPAASTVAIFLPRLVNVAVTGTSGAFVCVTFNKAVSPTATVIVLGYWYLTDAA